MLDRIAAGHENDWCRCRRGLRRQDRRIAADGHDHRDPELDEIGCKILQPLASIVGPAVLDPDVPAFDETRLVQASVESGELVAASLERNAAEQPDDRDRILLRPGGRRPCNGAGARQEGDDLPPPHSMTSRGPDGAISTART
jgi:hypothetical protein